MKQGLSQIKLIKKIQTGHNKYFIPVGQQRQYRIPQVISVGGTAKKKYLDRNFDEPRHLTVCAATLLSKHETLYNN